MNIQERPNNNVPSSDAYPGRISFMKPANILGKFIMRNRLPLFPPSPASTDSRLLWSLSRLYANLVAFFFRRRAYLVALGRCVYQPNNWQQCSCPYLIGDHPNCQPVGSITVNAAPSAFLLETPPD